MSLETSLALEVKFMASIMDQIQSSACAIFNSKPLVRMSLKDYLGRIYHYSECHDSCFVMAMILIDRAMEAYAKDTKSLPFCVYT
jgi:hypothetical protein